MDLWTVFRQLNKIEGPKFFLDSSLNNPDTGRYSYIGIRPNALLRSRGEIIEYQEGGRWSSWKGDPLAALQKVLNKGKSRRLQTKIPAPFCGGLVGYMGYDMGRNLEKIPHIATNDLMMYEQYWGIYDCILVMDHFQRQLWITANDLQKAKELQQTIEASINACHDKEDEDTWIGELSSNFSRETYTQTVKNIKERIRQGDVYQVNLSQRFTFPLEGSSLGIYKILRRINPAPFAAVLSFDEYEILSMSPERFLRIEDRKIETRPIKVPDPEE
nr:chorismate-binding protein [Syntrophomonas palmitatica]